MTVVMLVKMSFSKEFGSGPLSERYDAALKFAADAHRPQLRKNGAVPYLSHLLRVSGLTFDYGASEDVAIAALLHDVVEDCGGIPTLERVREAFGETVSRIVLDVSDSTASDSTRKAPWRERKEAYLERLKDVDPDALLVAACDKLDNVTSLLRSLRLVDADVVLSKFKANPDAQTWFYDSFLGILTRRKLPIAVELSDAIEKLKYVLTNLDA